MLILHSVIHYPTKGNMYLVSKQIVQTCNKNISEQNESNWNLKTEMREKMKFYEY